VDDAMAGDPRDRPPMVAGPPRAAKTLAGQCRSPEFDVVSATSSLAGGVGRVFFWLQT
jgi:hypothetical protein